MAGTLPGLWGRMQRTVESILDPILVARPPTAPADSLENPTISADDGNRRPRQPLPDDQTQNPRPRNRQCVSAEPCPAPTIGRCCACTRNGTCSSDIRTKCACRDANRECYNCLVGGNMCCNRPSDAAAGLPPLEDGTNSQTPAETAAADPTPAQPLPPPPPETDDEEELAPQRAACAGEGDEHNAAGDIVGTGAPIRIPYARPENLRVPVAAEPRPA